jgi:hypothetical protein
MKFLLDERIERQDGEIRLTIKPVTTSLQVRVIDMAAMAGMANRIALSHFCLKNIIEKISVNGEDMDPARLAEHADLSDHDTLMVMIKIGQVVCDAALPAAADIKK